jgi:peptide/nickel transport system substrate-binding protein
MTNSVFDERLSRRSFFGAAAGVAGVVLLDACGSSSSSTATGSGGASAGKPKPGGTLTAGLTGGSSSDVVDGFNPITAIDYARTPALNEQLVRWEPSGVESRVADEFSANADGTLWTIRLKSGLTFHNGKPVTADDLIYSFQYMLNPKAPTVGTAAMVAVDPKGLKKLDSRTIQIKMTTPQTSFREQLANTTFPIVPTDYDPKKPIGLGPFKLVSFTPGQQSVMDRFPDYYNSPMPYLDKLIIQDFATSTSQVNALTGGTINAAAGIPWVDAKTLGSQAVKVINEHSGSWNEYEMRTDPGQPFADVRVRQAMRLLVDRPQYVSNVYDGQGILGNDIFSRFDPNYNSDLPQRQQDPEKAKSLLKAAGVDNETFTMISGPWIAGLLEGAELISQQANSNGVKLNVKNTPIGQFVSQDYLKAPMASGYWYDLPYPAQAIILMTKQAGQNETHWSNPQWDALWLQLNKTVADTSQYKDIVHQMQAIEYNEGGYIIPGFYNSVDGVATNVQGLAIENTKGPLGGPQFELGWLS